VGAVVSPEDAKVATGVAGTHAEQLGGRGDFLLVVRGEMVRLQAAYASTKEIARTVNRSLSESHHRRSASSPRFSQKKVVQWAETLRSGMMRQMELWQQPFG